MATRVREALVPGQDSWLGIPAQKTPTSLTLPRSLEYDTWTEIGLKIVRVKKFCQWALSDWLNFGEFQYGEKYAAASALTHFTAEYLCILKHVGSRVEPARRRESLSFSHHKTVAMLSDQEQERFLSEAETNSWTRDELAAAVKEFTGRNGAKDMKRHEPTVEEARCPTCGQAILG